MICDKHKCSGCFACYNVCPKKAISMCEDKYGCIYPSIDSDKCINCNLCKKVCPSLNSVQLKTPIATYAMIAKNEGIRSQSSSGGAATIFAEKIIENSGIVYGCAYFKGCNIRHVRIDNFDDLKIIKGSKYVHSYVLDTFKSVKKDLNNNKKVLFIGTPCQIAGLKNYIGIDNDNLILIDLICHGVPPQKYLRENISDLESDNILFRTEKGYVLKEVKNNNTINETNSRDSLYYRAFFEALIFREHCYTCEFARIERCSDITLGDFWGLEKDSKFYDNKNKGVSLILVNTEKGKQLFEDSKTKMVLEERELQEAVKGNGQLKMPKEKNKKYYKFQKLYLKFGFIKAYKKINKISLLRNRLRKNKILNNVYHIIKK